METQETFDEARRDLAVGATELGGKVEVLAVLGRGGLGTVYEVRHLATKHHRALKVLHPRHARSAETVTRLLREATVAAALRSPHVAETYDAGRLDGGAPYVLMELLEGETLRARLDRGPMVPQLAARVVREACEGVAAAHAKGIVHRDLKPENLFLTTSAHDERLKVLDFGISKFPAGETPAMTAADTLLGTPRYMAPEQTENSHGVDERTDVYALGVVLYEALTGAPPYGQTNFASLVLHIHRGDHRALLDVAPEVPPALGAIAERAMHVDPERRFQTAEALAEALLPWSRSATSVHGSETGPEPRGERRWALWLAMAAGLALAVIGSWHFGRSRSDDDVPGSSSAAPLSRPGAPDAALEPALPESVAPAVESAQLSDSGPEAGDDSPDPRSQPGPSDRRRGGIHIERGVRY